MKTEKKIFKRFKITWATYSYDLPEPTTSLIEAKKQIRRFLGTTKIPANTQIY